MPLAPSLPSGKREAVRGIWSRWSTLPREQYFVRRDVNLVDLCLHNPAIGWSAHGGQVGLRYIIRSDEHGAVRRDVDLMQIDVAWVCRMGDLFKEVAGKRDFSDLLVVVVPDIDDAIASSHRLWKDGAVPGNQDRLPLISLYAESEGVLLGPRPKQAPGCVHD